MRCSSMSHIQWSWTFLPQVEFNHYRTSLHYGGSWAGHLQMSSYPNTRQQHQVSYLDSRGSTKPERKTDHIRFDDTKTYQVLKNSPRSALGTLLQCNQGPLLTKAGVSDLILLGKIHEKVGRTEAVIKRIKKVLLWIVAGLYRRVSVMSMRILTPECHEWPP